ncbi:class I SAM-dependent methyltransferase [Psychrobacillus lasiicapitis]|uniref:Class I SAM-dependent methyltransferase n=1 Tax=Psychrobacillus lasiicapitis TaxID=1636719 RepID=A0A544TGR2_9BACI|nr:class I SAM-dependent methyltransferase [Psychrobacillus lasiicapitis]TQR16649.1 class I SAM-dependent methyltransferase [Psychrobacillus lasiicapitis]GGA28371.1 methyltransferase [Psychrobacillus lasiicapitis]
MDNTQKFDGKAVVYAKARPGYANELVGLLSDSGVGKDSFVADIGSGTGIFSNVLLDLGCHVYGVEPNEDMRKESEKKLAQFTTFHPVNGAAENTTLPDKSVDFITVAQAFHWFHTERFKLECKRIIKENGKVILIWNSRIMESPMVKENEQIFRRFCLDFKGFSGGIGYMDESIQNFFNNFTVYRFPNNLPFDKSKFIERNLSASYSLKENDAQYELYLTELNNLFDKYAVDGMLLMPNETIVYIGEV